MNFMDLVPGPSMITTTAAISGFWIFVVFRLLAKLNGRFDNRERQHTQELAAVEEKYRLLLEHIPDVVWTADEKGNSVFVSPNVKAIYGYSADEIVKSADTLWFNRIHPDDVEKVKVAYQSLFATGCKFDMKYKIKRKDGTWITLHDRSVVTYERNGTRYADGVCSDVSKEEQIQEYMQQSQKMDAVGLLAGGVAHDFNNLLSAILGYTQIALSTSELPGQVCLDLQEVVGLAKRGAQMTRQILDFSRRSVVERQPIQLRKFVNNMQKLFKRLIPENIEVKLESDGEDCWTLGDETQLQQILTNLAINSRDAMPNGGELRLKLMTKRIGVEEISKSWLLKDMGPGRWIVLSVADTGSGIAASNLKRIFEPFFTTKQPGRGTGLGLAQVYGIVKQMGGFVDVLSKIGWGTTFTIYLHPVSEETIASEKEKRETLTAGHGETLLLVEDESQVRRSTRRVLEQSGYRVLTASNGLEALQFFDQNRSAINIVLSDVTMPVMGGVELFKALRSKAPRIPVVLMSGYAANASAAGLKRLGLHAWLEKPVDVSQLTAMLASALGKVKIAAGNPFALTMR